MRAEFGDEAEIVLMNGAEPLGGVFARRAIPAGTGTGATWVAVCVCVVVVGVVVVVVVVVVVLCRSSHWGQQPCCLLVGEGCGLCASCTTCAMAFWVDHARYA